MAIGVDIIAKVKFVKKPILFCKELLMKKKLTQELLDELDKNNPSVRQTKKELLQQWINNCEK
tara:strand:- start:123 stop:311 length:189 start_codon:yes stop_codon:yes gene_type:complete